MLRSSACAGAVLLVAGVARAAPGDHAAGQALFEQGRSLVEAGKFADACPKFEESLRLDPGLGTMLWLADCYENNGQTASAWAEFKDAAALAEQRQDARASVARDKAAALEARLSRLTVMVPAAASLDGLAVRRDGTLIGATEYGQPVPLDPGVHTISATAAGKKPWSSTVELARGPTTLSVTVPLLEDAVPAAAPPPPPPPAPTQDPPAHTSVPVAPEAPPAPRRQAWSTQRIAGVAVAAAGVVAVGVGTFFSFDAKSTYDASNAGPCTADKLCSQHGLDLRAEARSDALAATILLTAGAALVAGGGVLFFTAQPPRTATLRAGIAPHGAQASLTWLFP